MKRTFTILLALFWSAAWSVAAERAVKMGRMELIGSISRQEHVYRLHLQQPIKLDGGSILGEVQLSDGKFKKLADLHTVTAAQIGTGRYAVLGVLTKNSTGFRVEVIKCKPLDL